MVLQPVLGVPAEIPSAYIEALVGKMSVASVGC